MKENEIQVVGEKLTLDFSDMGEDSGYLQEMAVKYLAIEIKSRFEQGRILEEIHQKYANNKSGQYDEFCRRLGIPKMTAHRNRKFYNYIVPNWYDMDGAPDLLNKQFDALASGKANPQLAEAVKNGEVKNSKEYKEMEKRLAEAEAEAEQAKNEAFVATNDKRRAELRAEQVEKSNENLRNKCDAQAQELQKLKDTPATVVEIPADQRIQAELNDEKKKRAEAEQRCAEAESRVQYLKQNPPEPHDYRQTKRENEELKGQIATYQAHEEGMTIRQKSEIDKRYAKYKPNFSQISDRAIKVMDLITLMGEFPKNLEIEDFAECYVRNNVGDEARARAGIEKLIVDLKVVCDGLESYINKSRRLQVVK